jgi:hypothetical protein
VASGASVVITLTDGDPGLLRDCLQSLRAQTEAAPFEVLVPFDAPVASVAALAAEFPEVRFLPLPGADTARARAGASREHHDRLRSLGVHAAKGAVVAFIEDQSVAEPGWLAALLGVLRDHPRAGAAGGAVECGRTETLPLAVWHCDFARYSRPFPEAIVTALSDTNVAYPREALLAVEESWREAYSEPVVHAALRRAGYELWITPRAVTRQRRQIPGLRAALRERRVWGRSFGGARARGLSSAGRIALLVVLPALPFLLVARVVRQAWRRRGLRELPRILPIIILLQLAWSIGEAAGTLTGRADAELA